MLASFSHILPIALRLAVVVACTFGGLSACSSTADQLTPATSTIEAAPASDSIPNPDVVSDQSPADAEPTASALHFDTFGCGIFDPAIDAANQPLTTDLRLVSEIHAGLTRIEESGSGYAVEPDLAGNWDTSSGATRFEFTLRPGLRFSDGSPLLASDVKWSWERALRKSVAGSRARGVLGGIIGASDVASGVSSDLIGVQVIDERSLVVTLDRSDVDFPLALTDPVAAVLKRDDVAVWDDTWSISPDLPDIGYRKEELPRSVLPVGAGPFRLAEYTTRVASDEFRTAGDECVLRRNAHYWDDQHPRLDAVVARIAIDDWQAGDAYDERNLQRMSNAEVDFISLRDPDGLPDQRLGDWRTVPQPLGSFTRFLVFNPDVAPFDAANFRRALVRSYDTARELRQFATAAGRGIVPNGIGADRRAIEPLGFDPEAAVSELVAAGFSSTPSINEHIAALGAYLQPDAEPFKSWQEVLGLDIDVRESLVDLNPNPIGIAEVRVIPATPSPASILRAALDAFGADNRPDAFEELHRELEDALADLDATRRAERLLAIEQELLDDAYVMPLQNLRNGATLLVQPWVNGLRFPQFHGSVFRDVWFSPDAPARDLPAE